MFTLEALPAREGDCLLLTWGTPTEPHRMLTDGGRLASYHYLNERIKTLGPKPVLDYLVVTHIDGDHIEGIVRLLQDRKALKLVLGDVWFNGWPQIQTLDLLGAAQGEMVGALLQRDKQPWNKAFDGKAIGIPTTGKLPVVELGGGATATILGPGRTQLEALRRNWTSVLRKAQMQPGDQTAALAELAKRKSLAGLEAAADVLGELTAADSSEANGSSLAMLIEFDGKSILMTGDSFGPVVERGIRRLLKQRKQDVLSVDVVKLPHHGSAGNVSESLLSVLDSGRFVISTNGDKYNHPDRTAIERVLARPLRAKGTELIFDYLSDTTKPWTTVAAQKKGAYTARFPAAATPGIQIDI
jgi:beta-lactamase superfamily II metal-dependent hydrolase